MSILSASDWVVIPLGYGGFIYFGVVVVCAFASVSDLKAGFRRNLCWVFSFYKAQSYFARCFSVNLYVYQWAKQQATLLQLRMLLASFRWLKSCLSCTAFQ